MEAELQALVGQAESGKDAIGTRPQLADFKATLQPTSNGTLTAASRAIGKLPKEEKPAFGKKINETKQALEAIFSAIEERIEAAELAAKLPRTDPTLPFPENIPAPSTRSPKPGADHQHLPQNRVHGGGISGAGDGVPLL